MKTVTALLALLTLYCGLKKIVTGHIHSHEAFALMPISVDWA